MNPDNIMLCVSLSSLLALMGAHEEDSVLQQKITTPVVLQQVSSSFIFRMVNTLTVC